MKSSVDPALVIELIYLVIKLLMAIHGAPGAVSDHLTGEDTPFYRRAFAVWWRFREIRRIIRPRLTGANADDVEAEVVDRLGEMSPGTVLAYWSEINVGKQGS